MTDAELTQALRENARLRREVIARGEGVGDLLLKRMIILEEIERPESKPQTER